MTGVGTGIGSAVAVALADEGAHVVVNARTQERLAVLVETIRSRGGTAHAVTADLLDADEATRLARESEHVLEGPVDLLVNAVGAWQTSDLLEQEPNVITRMLDGNLRTVMNVVPPFASRMKEEGTGSIVNIGAVYGPEVAKPGQAIYNAAKAGVVAYTKSAAAELLPHGIRVNCVLPGGTRHDYTPGRDHEKLRQLGKDTIGTPEDVAEAILFLASDASGWTTGAALPVDGGDHIRQRST